MEVYNIAHLPLLKLRKAYSMHNTHRYLLKIGENEIRAGGDRSGKLLIQTEYHEHLDIHDLDQNNAYGRLHELYGLKVCGHGRG